MITENRRITLKWNPIFRAVNESKHRYRIIKGSAGSGKSVNIAQDYIKKLSDLKYKGANLLVVRKVEETNRDSTFAELQSSINKMFGDLANAVWKVTLNPLQLECRLTGNRIIFRGMNDVRQREKVKSITFTKGKLTWIWVEEATELTEEDIDILDDRLRGELENPELYYQITFSFNPIAATHWLKRKYWDFDSPDILKSHSTYRDNRFIDAAYYRRMELRSIQDPEGYKVYGLGEWGETGGLVLTNYTVHDFDTGFEYFDNMDIGQDFGFNHANAILSVGFKDGEIFICSEIYVHELDTSEIIPLADKDPLLKKLTMWCDSAEPDRIKMWKKAGYKAYPTKKAPGCVNAQIDYLKQQKIHIHPSCQNTTKEIQQWKWKKDQRTGIYLDEPVEFMDDAMAALRYAIEPMRQNNKVKVMKKPL